MNLRHYRMSKDISQEAKNQWLYPIKNVPSEDICDPETANLLGPPHRGDPYGLHHKRGVKVGSRLLAKIEEDGYFREYSKFISWCGRLFEVNGHAIAQSLRTINLWRNGMKGRAGGPQLIQMQAEIVAYAKRHSGGDEG